MNLFHCCLEAENENENKHESLSTQEVISVEVTNPDLKIKSHIECEPVIDKIENPDYKHLEEPLLLHLITHVELFLPSEIERYYNENMTVKNSIPIRKIPTLDNVLSTSNSESRVLKKSDPIPIDHSNRYL
jgi:hypothetical protein